MTDADTDKVAMELCRDYAMAGAFYLDLFRHPQETIHWMKSALRSAVQLSDRSAEGVLLGNLGNAYYRLGYSCQAIEYHEQDLSIARELGN